MSVTASHPYSELLHLCLKVAVALVSVGVVIATLSRPSSNMTATGDVSRYAIGVLMLIASLVCTGLLGMLQERTYRTYGPCWKEGVFYTVRQGHSNLAVLILTDGL